MTRRASPGGAGGARGARSGRGRPASARERLAQARIRWQGIRPDLSYACTGLILCIVVYLTTSVFLHAAYIRYFWFVLGLSTAASHLVASEEGSHLATLVRRVYGLAGRADGRVAIG